MMKKTVLLLLPLLLISLFRKAVIAENEEAMGTTTTADAAAATAPARAKKFFLQVGALEKKDGDRFLLRKRNSHVEFFINEDTKIFLRKEGSPDNLEEGNYLVIRGPKNKKVALANAVYIYRNKEEYGEFTYKGRQEKKEENRIQKQFSTLLRGTVKNPEGRFDGMDENMRPVLIVADIGDKEKEYFVSYDEDTYWIFNKRSGKEELNIGDRLKLYFDKRITIRYKSYPVKIIIERAKVGI